MKRREISSMDMDDNKFDKILKEKLESFEGEPFDPSAMAGLVHRLDNVPQPSPSWYQTYRTEFLVASSVVIICLFNGLFYWFGYDNNAELMDELQQLRNENQNLITLQKEIAGLQSRLQKDDTNSKIYLDEIDGLKTQLSTLMSNSSAERLNESAYLRQIELLNRRINDLILESAVKVDTVYLTADNSEYMRQIASLNARITEMASQYKPETAATTKEQTVLLGAISQIPDDIIKDLLIKDLVTIKDDKVYLQTDKQVIPVWLEKKRNKGEYTMVLVPVTSEDESVTGYYEEVVNEEDVRQKDPIPVKLSRELEKHYSKGVGIKLGPSLGSHNQFYDHGRGKYMPEIGASADFILSPSVSIETGLKYSKMANELEGSEDFSQVKLPGFDPTIGPLSAVEIESELLEFPINFRYRYPRKNGTFFGTVGYTPVYYISQVFDYDHTLTVNGNNLKVSNGENLSGNGLENGFLNIGVGLTEVMKKDNYLEFGIQYKHGLQEMGAQGTKPRVIGFRTAYWFKIR